MKLISYFFLFFLITSFFIITGCSPTNKNNPVIFRLDGGWYMPPAFHGNPYAAGGDGSHMHFIWERLFLFVPSIEKYYPILALNTELSKDQKQFKITLRKNVVWHDGQPFTSKDVKTTFLIKYAMGWGGRLKSISTPDKYTIIFNWKVPFGNIDKRVILNEKIMAPYHLFKQYIPEIENILKQEQELLPSKTKILEKDKLIFEAINVKKAQAMQAVYKFRPKIPIGTGPFQFSFVTASDFGLKKFKKGWSANKISIDEVRILKSTSNDITWTYLIAGELDAAHPATSEDVTKAILSKNKKNKLILPSDYGEFGFIINMKKKPLSDINFRKAIAHAIKKDDIRMISYFYGTTVSNYNTGILHSLSKKWLSPDFLNKMTEYKYDIEKARLILEKAGYQKDQEGYYKTPKGLPIKLEIAAIAGHSDWVLGCESLSGQLKKLGIKNQIRTYEPSLYHQIVSNNNFFIAANFGTDYKNFAHPATSFQRYFGKGGYIKVASGMPNKIKSFNGKTVNLQKLVETLSDSNDINKIKSIIEHLAWISNEKLPFLTIYEKNTMMFLAEGVRVKGWPDKNDPIWSACSSGVETLFTYLMAEGILKGVKNEK